MKWKKRVAEYLSFTRKDRIAIITLLVLIAAVFFLPEMIHGKSGAGTHKPDTAWIAAIQRISSDTENVYRNEENNPVAYQFDRRVSGQPQKNNGILFYFDPNSLSEEGWRKLGLRDKTIATIQNYISKGGRFRKPEDLSRIYGLFPNEYERIAPYIRIENDHTVSSYPTTAVKDSAALNRKTHSTKPVAIDINTADTAAWIALPGIGSKLATRIVNFREKLGGFYSINQVAETFGLPDTTFQKIKQWLKLDNPSIRKININSATLDELKMHPYIRYVLANPIVAYRNEHGPFSNLDDLRKIMAITDEIFKKISPYLTIEKK